MADILEQNALKNLIEHTISGLRELNKDVFWRWRLHEDDMLSISVFYQYIARVHYSRTSDDVNKLMNDLFIQKAAGAGKKIDSK
ncbi:MAG: hypothetical protein ABIH23_08375 [bacterium]